VPEHRTLGARGGDRPLATEPRERQRSARVDLGDAERRDRLGLWEVAQARCRGTRVEAVDEPDRIAQAGLLDEQALERVDRGVELRVSTIVALRQIVSGLAGSG
jgi:hypothetical protein